MIQEKIDLKKEEKQLYKVKHNEYKGIMCPKAKYLALDGEGNPNNNEEYQNIVGALYKMAYSLKMEYKKRGKDFVVMPLAGEWWAEDMRDFCEENKENWKWTMMIQIPKFVENKDIEDFKEKFRSEEGSKYLKELYLKEFEAREVFATLYIGAYRNEGDTIKKLHATIKEEGYKLTGKHIEIYLSDPRRVEESRLRTIIVQPVVKA